MSKTNNIKLLNIKDDLYDYCRWNQPDNLKKVLENSSAKVDITFDDGQLFKTAISSGCVKILQTLLQYYEEHFLNSETLSKESVNLRVNFESILENAVDTYGATSEIKSLLEGKSYIAGNEESDEYDNSHSQDTVSLSDLDHYHDHEHDIEALGKQDDHD